MGHIHFGNLIKVSKHQAVREMPEIHKPNIGICEAYQHGKQTRVEFKTKEHSTTRPLELVHTDLCGPPQSNCQSFLFHPANRRDTTYRKSTVTSSSLSHNLISQNNT